MLGMNWKLLILSTFTWKFSIKLDLRKFYIKWYKFFFYFLIWIHRLVDRFVLKLKKKKNLGWKTQKKILQNLMTRSCPAGAKDILNGKHLSFYHWIICPYPIIQQKKDAIRTVHSSLFIRFTFEIAIKDYFRMNYVRLDYELGVNC